MSRTPRNQQDLKQAPVRSTPSSGTWILETGGGTSDGGGGADVLGPVAGFTSVGEIGTRFVSAPDRLVHLTVGFIPICPTPQPVTYFISPDDGQNWIWIGWQKMQNAGQQLHVDRLAPGATSQWRVACAAGNLGGDPSPIPDASLNTLYVGVVRSASFTVVGLSLPPTTTGITATIGSCSNVVSADGFTQYGSIPGVVYTDPVGSTAFFVRISVQILDAGFHALAAEQPYGGTQITGGSHTEKALLVTYIPGLAFVRYRFYLANRNSQGGGDFNDPTTNALQMVAYNGRPLADHYDVAVNIPAFIPIDPDSAFNVTSVTAAEVGPKYQDTNQGLHTSVGITPVIDADYSSPRTVTIWLDFGTGVAIWQGWYTLTGPGQSIRIGDATLGTDGVRKSGNIWVPANTAQGNWVCYCAAGHIDNGINPSPYKKSAFTVTPVTSCLPNGTTQAQFVPDPTTSVPIIYSKYDPGVWYWEYYELTFVPPTLAQDPNYWFTLVTVQKGATIGGVWTPAPDAEGINEDPFQHFLGRAHAQINQLPGISGGQTSILRKFGNRPATWVIPVAQNADFSPNPYREFRFLIYNVSRLGTDTSGSGGAGTYTLQTSCWPGGADHFILIPQPQAASLDIRAANPATISLPLVGGGGQPVTLPVYNPATGNGGLGPGYLGPQSVQALNMAQNSITAANKALAASSVVDPNIVNVGINKVTYGTSVFAGDVVLSRGISLPVIILQNSGIFFFGQSDASTGATGLTSRPWVGINSNGIGVFQGGAGATAGNGGPGSGGSVFIDASTSSVIFYSKNGDPTKPYVGINSAGIGLFQGGSGLSGSNPGPNTGGSVWVETSSASVYIFSKNGDLSQPYLSAGSGGMFMVNGKFSATVQAASISLVDGTNLPTITRQILINANGIAITNDVYGVVLKASAMQFTVSGSPKITIDSTTGITLSNGGSSSVTITASAVSIVNGVLNFDSGTIHLKINPSISTPLGTVTGMMISDANFFSVFSSSAHTICGPQGSSGQYASIGPTGFIASMGGAGHQTFLGPDEFQMTGLRSTNPGAGSKDFWYDPADGNRVKFAP
jgi:hypothetical protein